MTQEQGRETPALRKLPHRDCQFKACLGYKIRFCFNETKQTKAQTCNPSSDSLAAQKASAGDRLVAATQKASAGDGLVAATQ